VTAANKWWHLQSQSKKQLLGKHVSSLLAGRKQLAMDYDHCVIGTGSPIRFPNVMVIGQA
jgi:hypothetical protein